MATDTDNDTPSAPHIIKKAFPKANNDEIQMPWVEKYRPASLAELVAHEDIVSILTRLIDSDNLPHLLLYGPPGTGKVRLRPLPFELLLFHDMHPPSNPSEHVVASQRRQP